MTEEQKELAAKSIKLLDSMPKNYRYMFLSDVWEVCIDGQDMTHNDVYTGWDDAHPEYGDITLYEYFKGVWMGNINDELRSIGDDEPSILENDYILLELDRLVEKDDQASQVQA